MPYPNPSSSQRRTGSGFSGSPIDKRFGPSSVSWPSRQSGGPSSDADTTASQRMSVGYSDEDTNFESPDDEYEGECGCNSLANCSCPRGGIVLENLLRSFIRGTLSEDLTGSMGVWARSSSDMDSVAGRKPDLGDSSIKDLLDEIDLVDEDEDELYPDTNEFSAAGAAGGGAFQMRGYSLPMGGKSKAPKSKTSRSIKGKKITHG